MQQDQVHSLYMNPLVMIAGYAAEFVSLRRIYSNDTMQICKTKPLKI